MKKLYLDLDRTLFRTNDVEVIWKEIGRLYPDSETESAYRDRAEFYVWSDEKTYYHDMSAQLRALGLEPTEVYARIVQSEIADGRLGFDGLADLIEFASKTYDVVVLTYGVDDYQRFKAALCPALVDVPVVTTLRHKREYLQSIGECWLVDDKPIGDELPEKVHFIQVSLEGNIVPAQSWPVCVSLNEVRRLLI